MQYDLLYGLHVNGENVVVKSKFMKNLQKRLVVSFQDMSVDDC